MVVLGYIIMGFWTLQFYMKRHYMLSATLLVSIVYGIWYKMTEGTWEMLVFNIGLYLLIYILYLIVRFLYCVLDKGSFDKAIRGYLARYKYAMQELEKYMDMKTQKLQEKQ